MLLVFIKKILLLHDNRVAARRKAKENRGNVKALTNKQNKNVDGNFPLGIFQTKKTREI